MRVWAVHAKSSIETGIPLQKDTVNNVEKITLGGTIDRFATGVRLIAVPNTIRKVKKHNRKNKVT